MQLATLAGCLAGCFTGCMVPTPVKPPPPEPPTAPVEDPPAEPTIDMEALRSLLHQGERALADDRLLTPEDDSAHLYYTRALELAPESPEAREGLERIVERYIDLTRLAIERGQWARARSMLARATLVDRTHVGIRTMREQVAMLSRAQRLTLELTSAEVRERTAEAAAKLAAFGEHARRDNARVSIRVGSDGDARWIYEQLKPIAGRAAYPRRGDDRLATVGHRSATRAAGAAGRVTWPATQPFCSPCSSLPASPIPKGLGCAWTTRGFAHLSLTERSRQAMARSPTPVQRPFPSPVSPQTDFAWRSTRPPTRAV